MELIRKVDIEVIEQHLCAMGSGNHQDNMRIIRQFEFLCLVSMSEEDFLSLVFLQNDEVAKICPRDGDRRLRTVAASGIDLGHPRLSSNWDLDQNLRRTRSALSAKKHLSPLLLREANSSERRFGDWYLRDGSHRALGYATLIVGEGKRYVAQEAYCAMTHQQCRKLLSP